MVRISTASHLAHITASIIATCIVVAAIGTTSPARAQTMVPTAQPIAADDDVAWEERKEPYEGGVLRPGMQLEGHVNWVTFLGAAGFVAGWALGFTLVSEHGAIPMIPFAGGLIAEISAVSVIGAVLQPLGVAAFIFGLATPRMYVVYDAPVGSPSISTAQLDWSLSAPGADLGGASVVGSF